ncbi:MAG: tRNA (N(6)-L-threonylcarbamoyladenosine(37)-C(2))-methylthiotransferase MtaB [Nitrospiria bacterium]
MRSRENHVRNLRVSFHTLGCRLNHSESVSLGGAFQQTGFRLVHEDQPADLSIINSCAVTEQAESKCRALVRRILKKNPDTFVAVTGCYAQTNLDSLKQVKGIDLIAGTDQKMELVSLVQSVLLGRRHSGTLSAVWGNTASLKQSTPLVFHTPKIRRGDFTIETERFAVFDSATRPNIKIQDGCDFFCTFCIIPYSRGRSRSRRMDDILLEASAWVARGHREVVLTGVNLGEYTTEDGGLSDLIDALEGIDGLCRIRISSIEPTTISSRLLEQFSNSKKLCPYLHLPLQSGSDRILSLMGRRYTRKEYVDFVEDVTTMIPGLCLGADVMVGFPGEGDAEFQETLSLIKSLPFSYLHVFPFSRRKGTRLNKMTLPPVLPSAVKERSRALCDYSRKIRRDYYSESIGKTVEVLFETRNRDGLFCGLTGNYIRVGVPGKHALSGRLMWVRIQRVEDGLAIGEIVG